MHLFIAFKTFNSTTEPVQIIKGNRLKIYLLHVLQFDVPSKNRYTVPLEMEISPHQHGLEPRYELRITNNETFSFQIIRRSSRTIM